MITVRKYQQKDKENLRAVCIETAGAISAGKKQKEFLLATFCDYYIECEGENCFAAADENDEAVGYIFCAENYHEYKKRFKRDYLPRARKTGFSNFLGSWGSMFVHGWFAKNYPAHLHIDITEKCQRQGVGTRLMDALTSHLREKGIKGLMLIVGKNNQKGRSFYKKYGFKEIMNAPFGVVMGIDLQ